MDASVEDKTFLGVYREEIITLTADHSSHF